MKEGSYPYFIQNRDNFEKIENKNIFNELSGTWTGKYYIEERDKYNITFKTESTADVIKNDGNVYEWNYQIIGDEIKFPNSIGKSYEVRKASDNVIIFYTYTIDYVPYWILYKE